MASTACRSGADIFAQLSTTRARSGQPASEICAPICAHGSEAAPDPDLSSITCDSDASGSKPAARIHLISSALRLPLRLTRLKRALNPEKG
jgi:hypothetical protein